MQHPLLNFSSQLHFLLRIPEVPQPIYLAVLHQPRSQYALLLEVDSQFPRSRVIKEEFEVLLILGTGDMEERVVGSEVFSQGRKRLSVGRDCLDYLFLLQQLVEVGFSNADTLIVYFARGLLSISHTLALRSCRSMTTT